MRPFPRALVLLGGLTLLSASAQAQWDGPTDGERPATRVVVLGSFQQAEGAAPFGGDTTRIAQWALPVSVSVPLTRDVGVSVRTGYTSTYGDGVEAVSRLSDTQLATSVTRPLGAGRAVASLGVNVPGGAAPTPEEAQTVFLVGQGFYGFRTPGVGRGLGVASGVAWAAPVTDRLALGAGLSYQYRGAYEPRTDVADSYKPGNELLLTAGADLQLGPRSTLVLDVSVVRYGTDTWGDLQYAAGDAVGATVQWLGRAGRHDVRLLGGFHRRGGRDVAPETEALLGLDAAVPAEGRVLGHALLRLGRLHAGVFAQGRYYAESEAFSTKVLLDIGVEPAVALADGLFLVGRVRGTAGDVRAVGAELGVALSL